MNSTQTQVVVTLPSPDAPDTTFEGMGTTWEDGWISTHEGSGVVEIGSSLHSIDEAVRWARSLLAAAEVARGSVERAAS